MRLLSIIYSHYTIKYNINSTLYKNFTNQLMCVRITSENFNCGGDTLANIRIDNLSSDTVTVFIDSSQAVIEDEGRVTFDSLEKGLHTLRIHRTRVPYESGGTNSGEENKTPFGSADKSLHTQLDYIAEIDLNSSKAVLTVKSEITSAEGRGLDAIFASYSVTPTGAAVCRERKVFANANVEKSFRSHHIKSTLFPTGVCSLAVFIISIVSLICAANGQPIDIGGTKFTLPWAIALLTVGTGFVGYSAYCIFRILKKVKELR